MALSCNGVHTAAVAVILGQLRPMLAAGVLSLLLTADVLQLDDICCFSNNHELVFLWVQL